MAGAGRSRLRRWRTFAVFAAWPAATLHIVDPIAHAGRAAGEGGRLTAPMPGKLIALLARAGEAVKKGQPLAVMEAMKMEHTITAPRDGTVTELRLRRRRPGAGREELLRLEAAAVSGGGRQQLWAGPLRRPQVRAEPVGRFGLRPSSPARPGGNAEAEVSLAQTVSCGTRPGGSGAVLARGAGAPSRPVRRRPRPALDQMAAHLALALHRFANLHLLPHSGAAAQNGCGVARRAGAGVQ